MTTLSIRKSSMLPTSVPSSSRDPTWRLLPAGPSVPAATTIRLLVQQSRLDETGMPPDRQASAGDCGIPPGRPLPLISSTLRSLSTSRLWNMSTAGWVGSTPGQSNGNWASGPTKVPGRKSGSSPKWHLPLTMTVKSMAGSPFSAAQVDGHALDLREALQHPFERELPADAALLEAAVRLPRQLTGALVDLDPARLDRVRGPKRPGHVV